MKILKLSWGRITEFFIVGVIAGMSEDLLAIYATTGSLNFKSIWIVALIAIPFAIISELIVDHFKPFHSKKSRLHEIKHQQKLLKDK